MVVTSFAEVDIDAEAVHEDGRGKAKEIDLGRKVLPWQQFLKLLPQQHFWLKFREDDEYFSIGMGYTISYNYELPELFITFDAPF